MAEKKIKVGMVSLGCPKNQVDAEIMLHKVEEAGYQLETEPGLADVVIINTCGFIQSAKEEAIENIDEFLTLKGEGRIQKVIVTGCLAERYLDEIAENMPEADVIAGLGCNGDIVQMIEKALNGEKLRVKAEKKELPMDGERHLYSLPFYAYLKIAEGCDNNCSYCAIPAIRGKYRSRPIENIVAEAKMLADNGVTELVVIAQDTSRYGKDLYGEYKLAELLRELCRIDGIRWIRTLYVYPERITDELIETIASEEKLVKYLDIPMQHCDGDILKAMNRPGDQKTLKALIRKLREKIPGIVLRTSLIAGFPGETNDQFKKLAQFVRDMRFDHVGCFAFSEEEGTKAAAMDNQVEQEVREHRAEIIQNEQDNITIAKNEKRLGQVVTVVVEGWDKYAECYFGRSEYEAPEIDGKIFFTSKKKPYIGQYLQVQLNDMMDVDMLGVNAEDIEE
jgi:ribosomal protein S12 methylthiotransferase